MHCIGQSIKTPDCPCVCPSIRWISWMMLK